MAEWIRRRKKMPRLTLDHMHKPALMRLLRHFENEAVQKAAEYIENEHHIGWDDELEIDNWKTKLNTRIAAEDWVGAALVLCIVWNLDWEDEGD